MSVLLDSVIGSYEDKSAGGPKASLKALAWARVSTDMQEERGLSMPEQLRQIREYAEAHSIEIVEEYSEATSAFKKASLRVEFHKMLERAKSDKAVNTILVHDYSRFSRDSHDAKTMIRELTKSGIKVISLNDMEFDPDTVAGVYLEAITFAKNEAYSREVAFHTTKGCRANVQTRDTETGWCYKNGGQPLFGYRAERLIRGEVKKGRPLIKSIWVPDDTIVAGKPVHEWARHCLVELAGKGATLDELRDFCNKTDIPAPRQQYWGHTTWNSLLHPHCLLEYAGIGVWNVRGKNQRYNPASEWVTVENAHEAIITEDEAQQIIAAREKNKTKSFDKGYSRSKDSSYLLSGGLFSCGRCGSNLMGMRKTSEASYYICGSQPHRRGLGCGPAVYVPQAEVESEVMAGIAGMLSVCTDANGFTKIVNEELARIWEESTGYDPAIPQKLKDIDVKIANIRKSVENGMPDADWAYSRMRELIAEKETLSEKVTVTGQAPQISVKEAMAYRSLSGKIIANGTCAEKKKLVRSCVDKITMTPDTLEVEIQFKVPEAIGAYTGSGSRPYSEPSELINYPVLNMQDVDVKLNRKKK